MLRARVLCSLALAVPAAMGLSTAPAQAAPATITDNGNGTFTVSGVSAGDYLYFCSSGLSSTACWNGANPVATLAVQGPISGVTFTAGSSVRTFPANAATTLAAGTYRVITNNGPSLDAGALVTVFAGGGGGDTSSGSSAPAPVLQQFAKPASGTCADAAPPSLNWAGVASGGWGESWAQWANGGAGGAVCTRTLAYSQSAGAWTVS